MNFQVEYYCRKSNVFLVIYTVAVLTYTIYEADANSRRPTPYLPQLLLADSALITTIYLLYPNPSFFQAAYGAHCIVIAAAFGQHFRRLSPSASRNKLQRMVSLGWGMHILGFVCWNIDNLCCDKLRSARIAVGPYWSWIFQMHGWWHIWTGIGSFAYILGNQYLRLLMDGKESEYDVKWFAGFLPRIEAIKVGPRPNDNYFERNSGKKLCKTE